MWRYLTPAIALLGYFALLLLAGGGMRILTVPHELYNEGRTFFVVIMAFAILLLSAAFYAARRINRALYGMIELLLTLGLGAVFFTTNVAQREFPKVPLSDFLASVASLHPSLTLAGAVYVGVRALDSIGEGLKPGTGSRAIWDKVFPKA